jgi:phenylacetate-coenzyme A ligase PaaK-like adenylate-forming protein
MQAQTVAKIFNINNELTFNVQLNTIFQFQFANNPVYKQWCGLCGIESNQFFSVETMPYLPISFFKTHSVISTNFTAERVFESSGTTGTINSKHFVKEVALYEQSFNKGFNFFYGNAADWCVIGLLPSYLERNNSSLVFMVNELIAQSKHTLSGFYLNEYDKLNALLQQLESEQQATLLIGVTFGLLDFAEKHTLPLKNTIIMETGGMKGRRTEMTRNEVHSILQNAFDAKNIHSEYGMTELLSQAYSKGNGRFVCPPWMKVVVRDEDDPLQVKAHGKGVLNIIDLANIYSCSFIATEDIGIVHDDGSFEVLGRIDNSDIRGCSLLAV